MNFWGGPYSPVNGESLIKDMIRDSEDDATVQVRVIVSPWIDAWP
jgi:hypothetical protein